MRIAVLIIALCLTMLVGLQSCAVMIGGNLSQDKDTSGGGATGIMIAFLFILGAAFVMKFPKVSMALFGIAAALGFLVGATTEFADMTVWGVVSFALAMFSFFGSREKKSPATAEKV